MNYIVVLIMPDVKITARNKIFQTACRIPVWPFVVVVKAGQRTLPERLFQENRNSNPRTRRTQMRKLKIIEHISLDGVIQVSGEDGDFPYGDWTASYRTPAGRDAIIAAHGGSFDLLLGRRTYDIWSGFWPKAPSSPIADGLNAATKYIATHRPESLEWGPFEGLGPDIVEGIRRIKSQDGPDLILSGSSTLTSTLLEHGLADEVLLVVYPVLLGMGKRFFAEGTPPRSFDLVNTKAFPSGIIFNTYKVAGPLKTG
jgi:dihydrofolate reductase